MLPTAPRNFDMTNSWYSHMSSVGRCVVCKCRATALRQRRDKSSLTPWPVLGSTNHFTFSNSTVVAVRLSYCHFVVAIVASHGCPV